MLNYTIPFEDQDLTLLQARVERDAGGDMVRAFGLAWQMGAAHTHNLMHGRRVCRICGCWEYGACLEVCRWVEQDLCSACAPQEAAHGR